MLEWYLYLRSISKDAVLIVQYKVLTKVWICFSFRLTYRLILREKELHFNIAVYNPSKDVTFSFNMLLHTYFKVPDVRRCQITGLHGCTYIDKTRIGAVCQEGRDVVTISEWTDRIYQNTPQEHIITNVVSGRKMRIQKYNFPDTVLWNPWVQRAKELADFGDDEYPNMVCVESGHVSSPVILLPGTAFEASQILQVRYWIQNWYNKHIIIILKILLLSINCIQNIRSVLISIYLCCCCCFRWCEWRLHL